MNQVSEAIKHRLFYNLHLANSSINASMSVDEITFCCSSFTST